MSWFFNFNPAFFIMRLFTALNFGQIASLEKAYSILQNENVKPVESLHLTLNFLGEIDEGNVGMLIEKFNTVKFHCFYMTIKGLGFFPSSFEPNIVWAGVEHNIDLNRLVMEMDNVLNFKRKRKFSVHLTIARVKRPISKHGIQELLTFSNVQFATVRIDRFSLMQSVLTNKGSIYTSLGEFHASN